MKRPAVSSEKLFYRISEVSKVTGLEPYVLRYWETEFSVLRPKKSRGGQRVYMPKDIETVLRIKKMLYEDGFTIAGARKQLTRRGGKADKQDWPIFLSELKRQLDEIQKIVKTTEGKKRPAAG